MRKKAEVLSVRSVIKERNLIVHNEYTNPLISRYASKEMSFIFSDDNKFKLWRKCWIALAKSEKALGLGITDEQIDEMLHNIDDIDYELVKKIEKKTRHDVMSHVHAFGEIAPNAKPIIHLGATSAFVGGNTDLIIFESALKLVRERLVSLMHNLSNFAMEYRDVPTLGFTHFQPAQPTTVGKRASLWLQDLVYDLNDLEYILSDYRIRGAKGTTGTQASYLELFDGDEDKVLELDKLVCKELGGYKPISLTGQTYTRKLDYRITSVLSSIAQTMHKMTNDVRLLQHLKELEEPFEKSQIGSSAMAYKRNPMRSERIASLSRYVIVGAMNTAFTESTQWFERTLDDSANRRLSIPESFLAVDAILLIAINITSGFVVNKKIVEKHLLEELPFMMTENIIMHCVKKGGDRQKLHEKIRVHSMETGKRVKGEALSNDLLERIAEDSEFGVTMNELRELSDTSLYIGMCPRQVSDYIHNDIQPILDKYKGVIDVDVELSV